jgi:hypothetical protein
LKRKISRPVYNGQPIKQDTSKVFRTKEPTTCVLVVNTVHGTLLCLMAATNADRVACEQWTTDEHLEDVFSRRADGSLLSLEDFIAGPIDQSINPDGTIDIQAGADEQHYTPQALADRWSLSATKIRRMFENEPDVLRIGEQSRREGRRQLKRGYYTMRIPASTAERVYKRLTK